MKRQHLPDASRISWPAVGRVLCLVFPALLAGGVAVAAPPGMNSELASPQWQPAPPPPPMPRERRLNWVTHHDESARQGAPRLTRDERRELRQELRDARQELGMPRPHRRGGE